MGELTEQQKYNNNKSRCFTSMCARNMPSALNVLTTLITMITQEGAARMNPYFTAGETEA